MAQDNAKTDDGDARLVRMRQYLEQAQSGDRSGMDWLLLLASEVVRERAQALLSKKFRFLEGVGHEVDSVVSDLWIKLKRHFQQKLPNSLEHLLALLALSVHHLLLDKASILRRREQRHEPIGTDSSPGQPAGSAENDPQALAEFTEFQEQLWKKLQTLPEDQRRVFEMHYFLGISQARIAEDLTLHPRQVSRLWVKASNAVVLGWKNA
ncbi:MAG: sigma-70 family RNA polymerase sigma factor [Gemmataceae bacterium]